MDQYQFFLGVDWGTQIHELSLQMGADGQAQRHGFQHTPRCLAEMMEWIDQRIGGGWSQLAVAIERPHGLLVELLLGRGSVVFAINPKKLDRFRERYSVAGAKSDHLDALVLMETLRRDAYAYNQVVIAPAEQLMIRELTHTLEDVEEELHRHANQLWEMLVRYYPSLLELTSGADEPWLWELLAAAPTPAQGAALDLEQLSGLLRRNRIRRITPDRLQTALSEPLAALAVGFVEAQAERTLTLLRCLEPLHAQAECLRRRIDAVLKAIQQEEAAQDGAAVTDFEIIDSLPGIGPKTLAVIYSEAAQPLRERNYPQLRALSGAAPVTNQSGRSRRVSMRQACNGRLRQALHHAANITRQEVAYWGAMYAGLRQRGHSHARALRGLVDRILKVLVSMLHHRSRFDSGLLGRIHTGH